MCERVSKGVPSSVSISCIMLFNRTALGAGNGVAHGIQRLGEEEGNQSPQ